MLALAFVHGRSDLCLTRYLSSRMLFLSYCLLLCLLRARDRPFQARIVAASAFAFEMALTRLLILRCLSRERFPFDTQPVSGALPSLSMLPHSDLQGRVLASLYFEAGSLAYRGSVSNFVLRDIIPISSAITDLVQRSSSLPLTHLSTALVSRVAGLFAMRDLACSSSVLTFDASFVVKIISLLFLAIFDMLDWSHGVLNSYFEFWWKARNVLDLLFWVLVTMSSRFALS